MGFSLKSFTAPFNPAQWGGEDDPVFGGELGDMIPGIGDARAQDKANKQNVQLNLDNRKWSEMMSNTAYQRAMADMGKAGLNPILAYQQGGASVPSSTAAQVSPSSKTGLVNAGFQAYTGISAVKTQQQQASTAQAIGESTASLQTAQTAKEIANTQVAKAELALKQRELRGKGVKDTLDREGGKLIQNIMDKLLKNSAKPDKGPPLIKNHGPVPKNESMFKFLNKLNKG